MAEHVADDALTGRELETLRAVAGGSSNKIIAEHLGISEHTVKGHLKSILSKLGASDRTHAVMIRVEAWFPRHVGRPRFDVVVPFAEPKRNRASALVHLRRPGAPHLARFSRDRGAPDVDR